MRKLLLALALLVIAFLACGATYHLGERGEETKVRR
jgi:hypothetical protein